MNNELEKLIDRYRATLDKQLIIEETLGYLPDEEEHCLDLVEITFEMFEKYEVDKNNISVCEFMLKVAACGVDFARSVSIKKFLNRFEIDENIERCGKRIEKLMEKEKFKIEKPLEFKAILFLTIFENRKSMNFMKKSMELIEVLKDHKPSEWDIKDFLYHK